MNLLCLLSTRSLLVYRASTFFEKFIEHSIQVSFVISLTKRDILDNIDVIHIIIVIKALIWVYFKYAVPVFVSWWCLFHLDLLITLIWLLFTHFSWHLFRVFLWLLIDNTKAKQYFAYFFYNTAASANLGKYIVIQLFFAFCSIVAHVVLNFPFNQREYFLAELSFWWNIFP